MQGETQSRPAESLETTLVGNVYITENNPAPFEVLGVDEDINGNLWVHTEANDYEESDWWDKRQSGVVTQIE